MDVMVSVVPRIHGSPEAPLPPSELPLSLPLPDDESSPPQAASEASITPVLTIVSKLRLRFTLTPHEVGPRRGCRSGDLGNLTPTSTGRPRHIRPSEVAIWQRFRAGRVRPRVASSEPVPLRPQRGLGPVRHPDPL